MSEFRGWMTRGTGESIFDPAEWAAPDGTRGGKRPPLWIIFVYVILCWWRGKAVH